MTGAESTPPEPISVAPSRSAARRDRVLRALCGTTQLPEAQCRHLATLFDDLVQSVADEETAMALVHAISRSMDRMVSWQVQVFDEHVRGLGQAGAVPLTDAMQHSSRAMMPLVEFAWQHQVHQHVQDHIEHRYQRPVAQRDHATVGFCDMVSFTKLVARSSEQELATLVSSFEGSVAEVVTDLGGRIVKTVGDEALFVTWDPVSAVSIAVAVTDRLAQLPLIPPVRVGVASGPVLERLGDVYGSTVNRANRLRASAAPQRIVLDHHTGVEVRRSGLFEVTALARTFLKGLGWCEPFEVCHTPPPVAAQWVGWGHD